MPQAPQPAAAIFFLIFLVWLIFPEGEYQPQSLLVAEIAAERIGRYNEALKVLNQTRWGDFTPSPTSVVDTEIAEGFVNLTGFRSRDGLAWDGFGRFREKGLELSRYAMSQPVDQQLWNIGQDHPVWTEVAGTFHGDWVRQQDLFPQSPQSYNLSKTIPSIEWIGDQLAWARNITGTSGRVLLRMEANTTTTDYKPLASAGASASEGTIRDIRGTATLEDTSGSGLNWDARLYGVHWPRQGIVIMTTTSEKFEGIFGLPHLSPGLDFFRSSQQLLNQTLAAVIAKKQKNIYIDQNMPWGSDAESSMYTTSQSPRCELVMYAQVHPPQASDLGIDIPEAGAQTAFAAAINAIESELEFPLGAPIHEMPRLEMSAVFYSPDCAFILETKGPPHFSPTEASHMIGMKRETHTYQIKTWVLTFAAVMFAQIYLLKDQMKDSHTPSTMGRISVRTLSMMVVVDGMTFTAVTTWVLSASSTLLPSLTLMVASFLSMAIGASFCGRVDDVQIPENRNARAISTRTTTTQIRPSAEAPRGGEEEAVGSPPSNMGSEGPLLPGSGLYGHNQQPSQPVIVPSDQDVGAEIADAAAAVPGLNGGTLNTTAGTPSSMQSKLGRYILLSFGMSFLAISSTTWYPSLRSWFLNLCAFGYLSLWLPQIYRNTMRNCRRALKWRFVIGQSVLRLLPIAYFWVKPDNVVYARSEPRAFLVLCCWVWLQLFVLAAQNILGPRVGVPVHWMPEAWDYHPLLREDNMETGGLPVGLVAEDEQPDSPTGAQSFEVGDTKRSATSTIDCAICREVLRISVIKAGQDDSGVVVALARRTYMVTPCRHIFHTECLENWMRFRLQCPICREDLPPL